MSDSEEEQTIADPSVLQKYIEGGDVAKIVAKRIIEKLVKGASVRQICTDAEDHIREQMKNVFKKDKSMKKGVAFPVCVCVNNCINHFSPLMSDDDIILKKGDVAKLDFGVHVGGFVTTVAYSVVVGATAEKPIEGRKADAILAAQYAMRAAVRMLKDGNTNYSITDTVIKVADCYKCVPVQGMLSFQLQEGRIEGEKTIVQNPSEPQRKEIEKCTFATHEVYAIDCIVSSGAGKGREMETRTTIYSRTDEVYKLKLKTSKEFYSKLNKEQSTFPFNLRSFDDEKRARMGVQECVTHKLVDPYPVLFERPNETVGQFKTTVLIAAKNIINVGLLEFDDALYKSEHKIQDKELNKLIAQYEAHPKVKATKKQKKAGEKSEENKENSDKPKSDDKQKKTEVTSKKTEGKTKKEEVNSKKDENKSKKSDVKGKEDEVKSKKSDVKGKEDEVKSKNDQASKDEKKGKKSDVKPKVDETKSKNDQSSKDEKKLKETEGKSK